MYRTLIAMLLLVGLCASISPAQPPAPPPMPAIGSEVTKSGTVLGTFDNDLFVMRTDDKQYFFVTMQEKHWSLGLKAGDDIKLAGKASEGIPRPEIAAEDIVVNKQGTMDPPRVYNKIGVILKNQGVGDLVGFLAKIDGRMGTKFRISDETGSIIADVGSDDFAAKYRPKNEYMIYIGVLKERLDRMEGTREIEVIAIKPLDYFDRPGSDLDVTPIKALYKERPEGALIRTEGRVINFIGKESIPLLYQDDHVVLLELSEKHKPLPLRAGRKMDAIGILAFEVKEGEEYAILKEARVIEPKK